MDQLDIAFGFVLAFGFAVLFWPSLRLLVQWLRRVLGQGRPV